MAQYKRLPRGKEKRVDEFVSWTEHAYLWLAGRKREALSFIIICLVLSLLIFLMWAYFSQRGDRANELMASAEAAEAGSDDQVAQLDQLIDKYPRTRSGHLARLMLGDIWLKKGDLEKAESYYGPLITASNRYGSLRILALHDLAEGYEFKGDYKKAAEYYLRAYNDPINPLKSFSYLEAARCRRLSNETDEARKIYQDLKESTALDEPQVRSKSEEESIWLEINASPKK